MIFKTASQNDSGKGNKTNHEENSNVRIFFDQLCGRREAQASLYGLLSQPPSQPTVRFKRALLTSR